MMLAVSRSRTTPRYLRCSRCLTKRRTHSSSAPEHCDVLVVGGGPAGLAFAAALGSSKRVQDSLRVVLVEASDLSKVKQWSLPDGYSNRVSSITNASRGFLQDIGAWSHVEETRTRPVEEMQVWDGVSDARITFSASELLSPQPISELSRLIENLNIQRGLLHRISSLPSIEVTDKVKVTSILQDSQDDSDWPLVHLSDGRVIRTRLLVGADGPNSPVRSYAGIQSYGWAYDTHAIVGTLLHAPRGPYSTPNTAAYQRFLPTGPIAFLPLSETASSMVWSTKPPLAAALKAVEPSVLVAMINAAFRLPEVSIRYLHSLVLEAQEKGTPITLEELREELAFREQSHSIDSHSAHSSLMSPEKASGIPPEGADNFPPLVTSIQPGTVASFPLRLSHAESYVGEGKGARTVLVGDAAHTIHPLAGQGLNLGLADAEALAECIDQAVAGGLDIGSHTALLPYPRNRYLENHKMLSAVDKLHKLYSTTAEPVVWARSVGLEVVNELDTVKTALMMSAGSHRDYGSQVGWDLAAKGVDSVARNLHSARILGEGVAGMVGAGVQQLLRQVTTPRR